MIKQVDKFTAVLTGEDLNKYLAKRFPELEEKGMQFTPGGIRKGASGHDVCFIHPKSAVGVLVELVQAPDDVIQELSK